MKTERRYLYLLDAEWRVLLFALNRMRSKLIAQGRYTVRGQSGRLNSLP